MKTSTKNTGGAPQNPRAASSVPFSTGRRGIKGFFKDVAREVKMVTWPTPQNTTRLTSVVIGVCILLILFLWVIATTAHYLFEAMGVA